MNGSQMYEKTIHIAQFVYAMCWWKPMPPNAQFSAPSFDRIKRHESIRAMKYANGKAITASVSVTAAAIPTVRYAMCRYVGSEKIVWKLSRFHACTIFPVNASRSQNADTNSTASAAR